MRIGKNNLIHRVTVPALLIAAFALLAPVAAYAQPDKVIVMECTRSIFPGFRETITLDLAAGTASVATIAPAYGSPPYVTSEQSTTITQTNDREITFRYSQPGLTATYVLNRYTGDLHISGSNFGANSSSPFSYEDTCQKQRKQF